MILIYIYGEIVSLFIIHTPTPQSDFSFPEKKIQQVTPLQCKRHEASKPALYWKLRKDGDGEGLEKVKYISLKDIVFFIFITATLNKVNHYSIIEQTKIMCF